MIDALISGKLVRDPALKVGQSGKPFCNFLLSVHTGDESPVVVSGIAFSDVAEKVANLKKGDAVAVVGPMKPTAWTDKASGEERHGLNITAQAALSPYDVKKRRGNTAGTPSKPVIALVGEDDGFSDPVDF